MALLDTKMTRKKKKKSNRQEEIRRIENEIGEQLKDVYPRGLDWY